MNRFDTFAIARMLDDLDLTRHNRELTGYWLSLFHGGELPDRRNFQPAPVRGLLPNLMILDVVPDRSVTVRLAGTMFRAELGLALEGKDWLAFVPADYRPRRLRFLSDIATGAIGRGVRRVDMLPTGHHTAEEVAVPFCPESGSGVHPILAHVDWAPERATKIRSREQALGAALAFETIPLPRTKVA